MPEIGGVTIEVSAEVADALGGVKAVREQLDEVDGDALAAAAAFESSEQSLDNLGDTSTEVAAQLKMLEAAANDSEDSVEELGDSAQATAASMSFLGASANAATIDLGIFNVTATTGTLAALTLLTAAAGAAATAFIGLGAAVLSVFGAFGILLGAGLIGELERIQRALQLNAAAIDEAIQPLAEVFGPLIEDAIFQLDELIKRIVRAVGDTETFENTLRGFGSLMMEVLPALAGLLFDIARDALPVVRSAFQWFLDNGGQIYNGVLDTLNDLEPRFREFAAVLVAFIPEFINLGVAVANLVLPALSLLIAVLTPILQLFNSLPDSVQTFALGLAALATLSNISLVPALFRAAGALFAVGQAALTALGPVGALLAALGLLAGLSIGTIMLTRDEQGDVTGVRRTSGSQRRPQPEQIAAANVDRGLLNEGPGININNMTINASSRRGGREAARGFEEELDLGGNHTIDTSRGP